LIASETTPEEIQEQRDFIRAAVTEDIRSGRYQGQVHTRFPPEPNGYLHIGHAKAISIDFGIAEEFGGKCNLRMDDSNPTKESMEFVEAIAKDIRWLGYDWEDRLFFASDYYDQLFQWALELIRKGQAYVDDLDADQIREFRGTLQQPGQESPHRNRSVEENLDLFQRMREGEFPDGSRVLRAKIDMASSNLNLRDPVMYRILHAHHYRTGDQWCIYPTYDYTHGQSDSIEGITHSLCDLDFENHRPLYDWFLEQLEIHHPRQIEFARLNISHTVLSKRLLRQLVEEKFVSGWDDPRMPTLRGLRRRGYTPEAIRDFLERIGVAKRDSLVDIALLEHCLREDLNKRAQRVMAVLNPLKVIIDNYPEGKTEQLEAINNPEDESAGTRRVPFSREIYIEREDFHEDPPKKYFRLAPGREVRLKNAYYITCDRVVKDPQTGQVVELHCTYDPGSRGGWTEDGRKVKGTLHWVSAVRAIDAEVRLYEHLFIKEDPLDVGEGEDFKASLNPDSLQVLTGCKLEPGLAAARPGDHLQFLRQGYFTADTDSTEGHMVFNRTVSLRDTWAKIERAAGRKGH
jgi:glutaminyl-tRNA synthetase